MSDRDARQTLSSDEGGRPAGDRDSLLELLDEGVCRLDATGALVDFNDAFRSPIGYEREELLGESLSTVVAREDHSRLSAVLGWYDSPDAPDGVRFDAVQVRFEAEDGTRFQRELRLDAARPSAPGKTVAVVREPADDDDEAAATPDLSALLSELPALAYRCRDPEGAPTFVGDGCVDVTGYDPGMLESGAVKWREDVVHPADRDRVREAVHTGLSLEDEFDVEYRILTADGRTTRVRELGRTVRGPSGDPVAIDGLVVDVADRSRSDRALAAERDHLAALNSLNAIVRDITASAIGLSTREEIERLVPERLAASDAYESAWIGAVDVRRERVEVHAEAGVEGPLDDVELGAGGEADSEPTGRAVRTGEVQVVRGDDADRGDAARREGVDEDRSRATAAVPIRHEGTVYGVVNVATARDRAFGDEEREIVGHLGDLLGHAFAAIERKRALTNDEVVEVEFRLRDPFLTLGLPGGEGIIRFERAVPLGDGKFLEYGTASPGMVETLRAMPDGLEYVDEVAVDDAGDELVRFERRLSEPPLHCLMAAEGNRIEESVIDSRDYRIVVQLSPGTDVRGVVETVHEVHPDVEFVSQRQVPEPSSTPKRFRQSVLAELTQRQRSVVESAYYAGFFEWPREATGEEVAESLGVTAPTFHQHLRKAEATVFEKLLCEVALSE
ncbi:helix-turn-helix domain-containing protein (plasmid) [Halorarum halophilum]|uniref:Helix-turn-helix domain-containing protein n=1 Tax=Halorarum halophilum TaxID=2743090 RepID=A0A7D5KGB1_9EURY|nr:bacterio-opsin activator domain-containing protein [Halobaculum halophilum]QLG29657.1 helix-turn-helix domain-containing protein [Halobaculum halophilum]